MTYPSSASRKGKGSTTASGIKDLLAVPKHLDFTSKVTQTEEIARAKCEQYHLYYGTIQPRKPVAIKRLRSSLNDNEPLRKALPRELKLWARLRHRNILPILGSTVDERGFPAIITEWMGNGSALDYVKKNRQADVFNMVKGIAEGMAYLHKENVVHADLRSDNVLVSNAGVPLVTDFGIARLLVVTHTIRDVKELMRGVRWMAIELVNPKSNSKDDTSPSTNIVEQTKESDVWAFGMVIYELLSKSYPFAGLPDIQVLIRIAGGSLPNPPKDIKNRPAIDQSLWELCKRCWHKEPASRPTMSSIVADMKKKSFQTPSLRSETTGSTGSPVRPDRTRARSLPPGIYPSITAVQGSPLEGVPPVPPLSAANNASNGRIAQPRSPHIDSSLRGTTGSPSGPLPTERRSILPDAGPSRRNSSPAVNAPQSRTSQSPSNLNRRRTSTVGRKSKPSQDDSSTDSSRCPPFPNRPMSPATIETSTPQKSKRPSIFQRVITLFGKS